MKRAGKILLSILSWAPLAWTILALIAAKFCYSSHTGYTLFYPLKSGIILAIIIYVLYGGFFIWLFLNVFLWQKKIISKKRFLYNILLTALGILSGYLALHYDVFGLSGSYID